MCGTVAWPRIRRQRCTGLCAVMLRCSSVRQATMPVRHGVAVVLIVVSAPWTLVRYFGGDIRLTVIPGYGTGGAVCGTRLCQGLTACWSSGRILARLCHTTSLNGQPWSRAHRDQTVIEVQHTRTRTCASLCSHALPAHGMHPHTNDYGSVCSMRTCSAMRHAHAPVLPCAQMPL